VSFSFHDEALKSLLTLGVSTVTLALGWGFGQWFSYLWNVRQRRREIQLSVSQEFYSAYGEFFAVWKLWNREDRTSASFDERRWELHKRAAAAEANIEGMLVKLSNELRLAPTEITALGRFRQGFQQLRQAIRSGSTLAWSTSDHTEYVAFKRLTSQVAAILAGNWPMKPPPASKAASQLMEITANRWERVWFELESNPRSISASAH
jgi:hypothetical protein